MIAPLELEGIESARHAFGAMEIPRLNVVNDDESTFSQLIGKLDKSVAASDKALQSYILKDGISTHDLMISIQNAKQSMQLAVEVRNKAVEAYNKLTQMSI